LYNFFACLNAKLHIFTELQNKNCVFPQNSPLKTAFSYKNQGEKTAFSDKSTNKYPRNSIIPNTFKEKKLFLPS